MGTRNETDLEVKAFAQLVFSELDQDLLRRAPQPDDQKFDKSLPVEESLQEPDLPLDDTNLTQTMDPTQIGDSTPQHLVKTIEPLILSLVLLEL
ncbi:hypothetical protein PoB_004253500 [Plakobranchus ocellatus]|uniref:Uncharacterized protein n=1 Tax=Plakobranchus ocellatus TaxID=259542 RepID=A0AAV4B627_9GAST|nr:hypothetical protein PoB_004253500 [Plakobranchus ocellatus]